ncbi:MAG TPA: zinc ribbon domain-containing protein [Desulfuromonadales bacterium]|nr:zinc ribbon domain-containing protein [Desulfuromonadales bacterium]
MPIYEYRCQACGAVFEKIRRQPTEKEACPKCGGDAIRGVSAPAAGPAARGAACGGGHSGFS